MMKNKQPGEVLEVTFKALDEMLQETSAAKNEHENEKRRQLLREKAKKKSARQNENGKK